MKNKKKIIGIVVILTTIICTCLVLSFFFLKKDKKEEKKKEEPYDDRETGISSKVSFLNNEFILLRGDTVYVKEDGKIVLKSLQNEEKEKTDYTDMKYNDSEFIVFMDNDKNTLKNADNQVLEQTTEDITILHDSVTGKDYYQIKNILYDNKGKQVLKLVGNAYNIKNGLLGVTTNQYDSLIDLDTMEEYRMYYNDYLALDSIRDFGDIAIIKKNKNYYIYNKTTKKLEKDVYTKAFSYGYGYMLSNSSKQIYLLPEVGIVSKNDLKKRKLSNDYYLEYSGNCFNLKNKEGKVLNDECISEAIFESPSNKDWYLVQERGIENRNYMIVFPNGEFLKTEDSAKFVGEYLITEGGTLYDQNKTAIETDCLMNFQFEGNKYSCSNGAYTYLLNEKMELIGKPYDDIHCHENGYCILEKDSKKGLWYKGNSILEPAYFEIILEDNYILLVDYNRFELLLLGDDKGIPAAQIQVSDDRYDDIDIEKVIQEYELEDIRDSIEKEKELFKKYAIVTLQNKNLGFYTAEVLKCFKVIVDNKELLDETYFLSKLKKLNFKIEKMWDKAVAGEYADSTIRIQIRDVYSGNKSVIYHELLHFIDYSISKDSSNYYYYDNKFLSKEEFLKLSKEERKKTIKNKEFQLSKVSFIVEGGAEFYSSTYFRNGVLSAYDPTVRTYEALIHIFGYDTMKDIFFSKIGSIKFHNLFLSSGKTKNEYSDFANTLAKITNVHTSFTVQDILKTTDTLVDLYIANKSTNWIEDNEFCYILYLIFQSHTNIPSKYQKEYIEISKRFGQEFLENLVKGTSYSPYGKFYYYTDGKKSYIMIENLNGTVKVEYDFQKNKVVHIDFVKVD